MSAEPSGVVDGGNPTGAEASAVTRWNVRTLPRTDDIEFKLTLSAPTRDPEVVAAIEEAAKAAGMVIYRVESPTEADIERGQELAREHGW